MTCLLRLTNGWSLMIHVSLILRCTGDLVLLFYYRVCISCRWRSLRCIASAAMATVYMYMYNYMHLVHVAVYVYVLREQGLCPVSESEFSLDPGEPNVHFFHGPWLSWGRSLLFSPLPAREFPGLLGWCLFRSISLANCKTIKNMFCECSFMTVFYGKTFLYHCMKAKVNIGCFTSRHRCRTGELYCAFRSKICISVAQKDLRTGWI